MSVGSFITVRKFIEMLQELPQDAPMVLSTDAEGNEIRMVNGVGVGHVVELQHRFMDSICEEDLDEYDSWVLTAEVW